MLHRISFHQQELSLLLHCRQTQLHCADNAAIHHLYQCADFSTDFHGEDIVYLVRYLPKTCHLGTCHLGIMSALDQTKGFEWYVDADFCWIWNKWFASSDPNNAKSRSCWVIFYVKCPISWASKVQKIGCLFTTEAKYIVVFFSDGSDPYHRHGNRDLHCTSCIL